MKLLHSLIANNATLLRKIRHHVLNVSSRLHFLANKLKNKNNHNNVILLCLGGPKGSPYVASAAVRAGYQLTVCASEFPIFEGRFARKWIKVNPLNEYPKLLESAKRMNPAAILVEQRNILLPVKAKLLSDLKLVELGDLSHRTSNSKIELRQALDIAELPNVSWCVLSEYKPNAIKFPFILKPETGTGSRGISIIENNEDLKSATLKLQTFDNDETVGGRVILEELIPGRQFDVEGVYIDKQCYPLALIEEHYDVVNKSIPSAWYLFSPPIEKALKQKIIESAIRSTAALGVINGAFHCEMRISEHGEIIAIDYSNRMGYPHLVSESCSYSFPEAYVRVMAGEKPDLSNIRENIVFQEYVRDDEKYDKYRELLKEHPSMLLQKNVAFVTAGIEMKARIALKANSFEQLTDILGFYNLIPKQWKDYYKI